MSSENSIFQVGKVCEHKEVRSQSHEILIGDVPLDLTSQDQT